jgi:hypothetical protein
MLKKPLIIAISGAFIAFGIFSCKKNDVTPTNPAEVSRPTSAASLPASEAQTSLTESAAKFSETQLEYTKNVGTVTSALNNLTSSSSSGVPSEFSPSLGRLSGDSEKDADLLETIGNELGNIGFLATNSASGRRIPVDFESAKGTWEYTIEKSSSTSSSNEDGVSSSYCNGTYWKKYYKQTSTSGDAIVIKFPSYGQYSWNSCDTLAPVNNATYTISKLEVTSITSTYCEGNVSKTRSRARVTAMKSSFKIGEKELMSYEFSANYSGSGERGSMTASGKFGDFEYSYNYSASDTKAELNYEWKNKGSKVIGTKYYYEFSSKIENNDNQTNCSSEIKYTPKLMYAQYKKVLKYDMQVTYGDVTLYTSADYKGFITEFETKYASKMDADGYVDTATQRASEADTVLQDKYFNAEIYKTDGSAKFGKVIVRYEKDADNQWSSYKRDVIYIVFADGSREKVSKRFAYLYTYNPFRWVAQVKYNSSQNK